MVISIENAEHYIWGEINDGWHLLKRDDMSVIQERVPPQVKHQFKNNSKTEVHFLVISVPTTRGDRINV